jgi:hypothetical protein
MKIVSGGQTGVDRAALDYALKNNIPCGGWCPKGRIAEDGIIDNKYPLQETESPIYAVRTRRNVEDSDATLILFEDEPGNGTRYTAEYANKLGKPLREVKISELTDTDMVFRWLKKNNVRVLNIAGPRESTSPGIYLITISFLERLFR